MTESVRNNKKQILRKSRIRKKIAMVSDRPRLTVFRSNKHFYAQIVDDNRAATLVSVSSLEVETKEATKKTDVAIATGKLVAEKAKAAKITKVVFDKGGYKFHGRVKAFADAAREGGLTF